MLPPEDSTDDQAAKPKGFIPSVWEAIKKLILSIWAAINDLSVNGFGASAWEIFLVFLFVAITTIVMLALLGPAIGRVFTNIHVNY
jgi:hypothetical protein